MSEPLIIVGAGGHAREVLDVVDALRAAGSAIDLEGVATETVADYALLEARGVPVLGGLDVVRRYKAAYVIAIGSGTVRRRIDEALRSSGLTPAEALVHPSAVLGYDVTLERGVVVLAHVSLASNVHVGRHVHLNRGCTIGHDCTIGNYSTVAPLAAISGHVTLGEEVTVGTGSCLVEKVRVGPGTVIGAGAAVVGELPAHVVAVGVPATIRESSG